MADAAVPDTEALRIDLDGFRAIAESIVDAALALQVAGSPKRIEVRDL